MSSPCFSESVAILRIFDQVGHYPTYSNTSTETVNGLHFILTSMTLDRALHVLEEHIAL